jgi:glycosyltransferase involved in cell wall biosynthesis
LLLARVLDACFEQTVPADMYEVVLVNDGSSDNTARVIEEARARASCAFTVVEQKNSGLARARNAGIAKARGERIIFIDDDVLPTPVLMEEHLRSHDRTPDAIVRGAVINTVSFDDLPPPIWTRKDYSGNYFWTSNVSLPLAILERVGNFTEKFREYGWEDIELGLRLRFAKVRGVFNRYAVAYHYKPLPQTVSIEGMLHQARAQARTAVQLGKMHPHWRVTLATFDHPLSRLGANVLRVVGVPRLLERLLPDRTRARPLQPAERVTVEMLRGLTYFEELEVAHHL